jgi:hypothetical protein
MNHLCRYQPILASVLLLLLSACTSTSTPQQQEHLLSLTINGSGSVSSNPTGIDCGTVCSASFTTGSTVTLTATPTARPAAGERSVLDGWSGCNDD